MTITRSVVVEPGRYLLPSVDDSGQGVIRIGGDNITVDFNGAELVGTPDGTAPDARRGTALQITGGRNITIKNARVRGYKIGLIARDAPGLRVLDSDFSYNWKQHLQSTLEREDLSDWMSYHRNEKDEWLRYGAAIYLRRCNDFEVKGVTVEGGQNGLMLTECNRGRVWNSNFSFLSSLGLGLYRSSDNAVMHNKIDWCVRGYSHGVYNRGQDSAGILVYEQSHRNLFAYNSVTHGGDGFFLWAGQSTMDTGKGGCNDNLLWGNDFSHAPTNGIEATFSRNSFINNLLLECWHGVWGGYSFNSTIADNVFGLNAQAIAIEHGQDNVIARNSFHRDNEGIVLWQNATQDPNWGYAKARDTRSRDYRIEGNTFSDITLQALRLMGTKGIALKGNTFKRNARVFNLGAGNSNLVLESNTFFGSSETLPAGTETSGQPPYWNTTSADATPPLPPTMQPSGQVLHGADESNADYLRRFQTSWSPWRIGGKDAQSSKITNEQATLRPPAPLRDGADPFIAAGELRGRRYILVDEWGPYDFKSPLLWPRSSDGTTQRFEILGPPGQWKVAELRGVESVSTQTGSVPGFVDVRLPAGKAVSMQIELEYMGGAVVSPWGVAHAAGRPYRFGYTKFFMPIAWQVKWFRWDEATDPRTQPEEFQKLLAGEPIKTESTDALSYAWPGVIGPGLPADYFATVAEGRVDVPPGDYTLSVTTDDGVRVWVDDELVIKDAWKYQGPTLYTAELKLGGAHKIRVEHFEIDGYATLQVALKPKLSG